MPWITITPEAVLAALNADELDAYRNASQGSSLIAGAAYDDDGNYVVAVTAGKIYTWTKAANDTSLVNGMETLNATGTFTAQGASVTLTGAADLAVSAEIIPQ